MLPKVSIVIPVYQNERTLEQTCREVSAVLDGRRDTVDYEFVCVNDGSSDGSLATLLALQKAAPAGRFRVVNFVQNYGQRSALLAGYRQARGACIVSMSADLQDPAEVIGDFVTAWLAGHRVVIAARQQRNDGFFYDLAAKSAWRLFQRTTVRHMPPGGFDYFLMDRRVCDEFVRDPEQGLFMQGRLLFLGGKPHVIPYERRARREGRSQTSMSRRIQYFIDGIAAYSYLPLRLMSLAGILVFLAGIVVSGWIAWHVWRHGSRVEGWASLVIIMLFLNGVQMLFMGVMGEYVWRTLQESRRRPHYVIDSISE